MSIAPGLTSSMGRRQSSKASASATRLVIPSRLPEAPPVIEAILEQARQHHYPEQAVFGIRLALDEAISNAINHGNGGDSKKQVTVEYTVTDQQLHITICDEGCGFQPERLPDPTLDENLTRPCGRGVMLMRAYMSDVHFNKAGNCVTLVKRRDD